MVDSSGTTTYNYDVMNRLDSVTYPGSNYVDFGYDWVGNRKNPPANPNGYTFNAVDELTSGGREYYADGSMQEDNYWEYEYGYDGLMTSAVGPEDTVHVWDADGSLIARVLELIPKLLDTPAFVAPGRIAIATA